MEGAGSRLGRASSRYGQQPPSSSAATFSGRVRRWEKKWVHVSSLQRSRPSITRHQKSNSTSKPTEHVKSDPGVLLCKWTPLSEPRSSAAAELEDRPLSPPRRKMRYTPIAVLEEKKREAVETKKGKMSDDESYDGLLNINQSLMEDEHQTTLIQDGEVTLKQSDESEPYVSCVH
ncbi:hypothetical protein V2J09_017274 [Rumex salicifolius]